jgi:hypothetical protein
MIAGSSNGFCPGLLECLHFFNRIQTIDAILHYRGPIQNFLGRVVAFFAEWWSGPTGRGRTLRVDIWGVMIYHHKNGILNEILCQGMIFCVPSICQSLS